MRSRHSFWILAVVPVGCLPDVAVGEYDGSPPPPATAPPPPPPAPTDPLFVPPTFGPTVRQNDPPPPVSGGTLTLDGEVAVAADPDRDVVHVVDLGTRETSEVVLSRLDEPGRVAIAEHRAYVVLRGAGQIATIDLAGAQLVKRTLVCPAPRGIAVDLAARALRVVCAGGEFVTVPLDGAVPTSQFLRRDLRDVIVRDDGTLVLTTFRGAEELTLAPGHTTPTIVGSHGHVAWRAARAPDGHILFASIADPVETPDAAPLYYSSRAPCAPSGPTTLLSSTPAGGVPSRGVFIPSAVLPVDVAASQSRIAIAAAGNGHTRELPQIVLFDRWSSSRDCRHDRWLHVNGEITAVAFMADGRLVAQSREPAALFLFSGPDLDRMAVLPLPGESREDTGHAIFHSNAGSLSACASCHAEGRDDGRAWVSLDLGPRRTPSLAGTLRGTAPYHWDGKGSDLSSLSRATFEQRMRGPALTSDRIEALDAWTLSLRPLAVSPASDPSAVLRGESAFAAKCATCHSGSMRTNSATMDIGTGGVFQVPSLVNVGFRAPYRHDGDSATLVDLIAGGHGSIPALTHTEASDVASFLETL